MATPFLGLLVLLFACLTSPVYSIPVETTHSLPSEGSFLAPFFDAHNADLLVPHQFVVRLQGGYTLERHWETIGVDISKIANTFKFMEFSNMYYCNIDDDSIIHDRVRKDRGVKTVEQDEYLDIHLEKPHGKPFAMDLTANGTSISGHTDHRQLVSNFRSYYLPFVASLSARKY